MKAIVQLIFFILFFYVNALSQDKAGIYLNASDYMDHKLSFEIDCNNVKHAIRLHTVLFDGAYITLAHNGVKQRFLKKDIYGYADCNKTYRFYKNSAYCIERTDGIYVYSQEEYISQYKSPSKVVHHYYFSTAPGSEIIPLSPGNLKDALRR